MKKFLILFVSCLMCQALPAGRQVSGVFAQENNKLVILSKQIIEAKNNHDLYAPFKELKDLYFKENKYSEFAEFLRSLEGKKKSLEPFTNYYVAEARYYQLKYLEETQSWDEYFAQGNTYRDEISQGAQKTIASTAAEDPLNVYARLLFWRFHKDQEDAFKDTALEELMAAARQYSAGAEDTSAIKDIADQLNSYGEKGRARQLYKVYVDKLAASEVKNSDLEKTAADFYQQENLELAEALYDVYIERTAPDMPKGKLVLLLAGIAKIFAYKDNAFNDPVYAEKIFQKIEEAGGKSAFDEELIYLRAFNLEKAREFLPAKERYLELVSRFPKTAHRDEADFKAGIIQTYVGRDITQGRVYFEKLAEKETLSPQVISSLYQLGLLAQWEEKPEEARGYYNKLLEKAEGDYKETVELAKERLKEIEDSKPMEYNLKTFLDVSLKGEYSTMDMTRLDLRSHPYRQEKGKSVDIASHPFVGESGCLQVEVQYLWSGHLGTASPSIAQSSFNTEYLHPGTKEINLVVVTPSGILDRDLNMVDIR